MKKGAIDWKGNGKRLTGGERCDVLTAGIPSLFKLTGTFWIFEGGDEQHSRISAAEAELNSKWLPQEAEPSALLPFLLCKKIAE